MLNVWNVSSDLTTSALLFFFQVFLPVAWLLQARVLRQRLCTSVLCSDPQR